MNVKLLRIKNGLTQKELAKMVGVSHVTIGKVERGLIDEIHFGTLRKIAVALNSSFEELFLSE